MKKMNNRGFLLAESLIVSTFVLTVLILLFIQFKSLFNSYEDSYDYNTVEGIYNLNTMKKYIIDNQTTLENQTNNVYAVVVSEGSCNNNEIGLEENDIDYCKQLVEAMKLKTLIYTNSIEKLQEFLENSEEKVFPQSFINFVNRIEAKEESRLIGQFEDGTFATIVYE